MTSTSRTQATTTTTITITADNKRLVQTLFAELAAGNRAPFRDHMADDLRWTLIGTTRWSRTYLGKRAVLEEMFRPVYALFEAPPVTTAHRILADEDHVVVEFRGQAMTRTGKPYNNTYCMILRLAGGKIIEVTEYCDTALVEAVL